MSAEDRDKKIQEALKEKDTQDLVKRKNLVDKLKWATFFSLLMIAGAVLYFMFKGVEAKRLLPFSIIAISLVALNWTLSRATRKLMAELNRRGHYNK